MTPWDPKTAKHRTADNIYQLRKEKEVVEVYDDEEPGFYHLYFADGDLRWPVRTVNREDPEHVSSVLLSWQRSRPMVDKRTDQSAPLIPNELHTPKRDSQPLA